MQTRLGRQSMVVGQAAGSLDEVASQKPVSVLMQVSNVPLLSLHTRLRDWRSRLDPHRSSLIMLVTYQAREFLCQNGSSDHVLLYKVAEVVSIREPLIQESKQQHLTDRKMLVLLRGDESRLVMTSSSLWSKSMIKFCVSAINRYHPF